MRGSDSHGRGLEGPSETRVDRLALERQDAEDALVDASQRLASREALEPFDAERELAGGERPLRREAARAQPGEVLGQVVLRAVDDPEVLAAADLQRRLHQAAAVAGDEVEGLDDDALAASGRQLVPPRDRPVLAFG